MSAVIYWNGSSAVSDFGMLQMSFNTFGCFSPIILHGLLYSSAYIQHTSLSVWQFLSD